MRQSGMDIVLIDLDICIHETGMRIEVSMIRAPTSLVSEYEIERRRENMLRILLKITAYSWIFFLLFGTVLKIYESCLGFSERRRISEGNFTTLENILGMCTGVSLVLVIVSTFVTALISISILF